MGFIYLCIYPTGYVALQDSKTPHRPACESFLVSGNFSSFNTAFPGWISVPNSFVSLFIFYIFSYLLSKTMGCFSGCLMSSASVQKLFCGIHSAFKCSFEEFVGEKVVSASYSSIILGSPFLWSILVGSETGVWKTRDSWAMYDWVYIFYSNLF